MARLSGPWQTRVSFAPGGGFGYRPGEVLVRRDDFKEAEAVLIDLAGQGGLARQERDSPDDYDTVGSFARFSGVPDTLDAVTKLNQAGIYAQVNHVLFAHGAPDGGGFQANPFYANPFYANPFYANPFYANPFYANPFYANPFYANPFYANPNPAADPSFQETGQRPSSARPALEAKTLNPVTDPSPPVIAILDTGYAAGQVRDLVNPGNVEVPDLDRKGYLDPVAGHGTFIAGIIEQYVPGCKIEVHSVISPYGDGDEVVIGRKLRELARSNDRLDLVNLSFGGYSSSGMGVLAEAIAALHYMGTVVVASAGNDGTSLPMYPAVLPYVVAVGALDHEGAPAPFTNYGPWVRACTLGVEVVSTFFTNFNGSHPSQAGDDIDEFCGWAAWSGTSFAAPRVVAALAHHMRTTNTSAHEAVQQIIDAPNLERKALLGTVVR
ncbi:MAG: S8 family serine peptidase [Acidimicrobiia bacterium]|nr:S8 family serine peptidase [Acidimicrobiia bacterium]MDH3398525.1 S8 family serine peptidase [Acidimicrobiia bacterium]MDH5616594.1 S8 family serine peptidase [Acidimicrobiia bacterium]